MLYGVENLSVDSLSEAYNYLFIATASPHVVYLE